jgi:hypothetical protein
MLAAPRIFVVYTIADVVFMNLWSIGLSALPLLIPVVVWAILQRRAMNEPNQPRFKEALPPVVDMLNKRTPRIGEFTSGGALSAGAKSTLVRDVLIGKTWFCKRTSEAYSCISL